MPRKKTTTPSSSKPLEQYTHTGKKRANNPPVGLVTPDTDQETGKKTYAYDPHLDPSLQWAGKKEHTSFDVPTVSLHVHERIDPRTIIEAVRKTDDQAAQQMSLFAEQQKQPLREAIEFYKHPHNWTNRLIAGDSLLVMNSLIEKEGMAGHVQMVYLDPPYGIRYGSNFQPFVNKREVKDGKDEDLTQEPETLKAFRDTWELGIHSYLTYLRDRLLIARELLHESGSIFVQISDENLHHVREVMDDVFGASNLVAMVVVRKTAAVSSPTARTNVLPTTCDYLVWYARDLKHIKYRQLYLSKQAGDGGSGVYSWVELPDGSRRRMTSLEMSDPSSIPHQAKIFRLDNLTSTGYSEKLSSGIECQGQIYTPGPNLHWKTTPEGMSNLISKRRAVPSGKSLAYIRFFDDFPVSPLSDVWLDTGTGSFTDPKVYVVQTNVKVLTRCILMCSDPGDIVFDPTCGSGTTAYAAEQWGRRWITCDTSRVSITLARQRLMTAVYDYYQLAQPDEGVGSGFKYKTVPHVTLKSIANNEPPDTETLYDQPMMDSSRQRIAGPFTVEAVPAPSVQAVTEAGADEAPALPANASIARSGETLRQAEWRDELQRTGIRSRRGDKLTFARVEPLSGTRWLHADAEVNATNGQDAQRAVISFGPEHQPMDRLQVARALEEGSKLFPKPKMVIFAAFQFDPEAAREIEETNWPGVTLLKAQMNADLLTDDLKKKRASNESFWLIGQPDVQLKKVKGEKKDPPKYQVEVLGFDYYNTRSGEIESGDKANIALWLLDTDYDGRSLFPRQVFFPMAGEKDGWARLAKNLKAEIDEELIEAYRGTISLPFEPGEYKRIAVKIVDDRGIESIKILDLE
ncbi:MAG TPA: site-specific DNA-methyltransferase [Blastocatellia bacterium]|nr:site-specific DNA-methyltransferase [Blastocatellia bacterium]